MPGTNIPPHRRDDAPLGCVIVGLLAAVFLCPAAFAQHREQQDADLEAGFVSPPASAYPRVYWRWLESDVTAQSITQDLEAMKRQGIRGAILFDAGVGDAKVARRPPPGPRFPDPQWRAMSRHAVAEADRLELELSLNLGSGWNCGGPWITPRFAAQKIVWSETAAEGPSRFSAKVPIASAVKKDRAARPVFYRDIAVLAVRPPALPKLERRAVLPKITASSSQKKHSVPLAADRYLMTHWTSKGTRPGEGPTAAFPEWIRFEFKKPFSIRSFYIAPEPGHGPEQCRLEWSEDGVNYQTLQKFVMAPDKPVTFTFPSFSSRIYRFVIDTSHDKDSPKKPRNVQIREVAILADGETPNVVPLPEPIKHWELKSVNKLLEADGRLDFKPYFEQAPSVPGEVQVDSRLTVDLTDAIAADGSLTWEVPEGEWTILRFGHTTTGRRVSTCSPGGEGLMLDPLSREALDVHWKAMAEPLIREVEKMGAGSLKYLHTEAWDIGPVNWTADFPAEFKRRRGYDLSRYLPVLAGRIVDGRDLSNRFLSDFRRTIGDCIAENHYGRLRDFAHRHKIGLMAESGGPRPAPIDALECLGKNDIPMGEFRAPSKTDRVEDYRHCYVKGAASAARVYGRKLTAAKGFTSIGPQWERAPGDLKPFADRAFCGGVNRIFFHAFTSSPAGAGEPGNECSAGTHFNPNVTWWEQSRPWNRYLARCQYMLTQGRPVADVCCYYGDGVPNLVTPGLCDPAPGSGYGYDVVDRETVLSRMSVRGGQVVLPDATAYHALVLPDRKAISPEVLRRVAELVREGATVVGPKPSQAPGLGNYPDSDKEVRRLADQLWGPCDGKAITEHGFGLGKIVWGKPLRRVMLARGVPPDFEFRSTRNDAQLEAIHRRIGATDVFFVANRKDRWEETACKFRIVGRTPELWRPDTGEIEPQVVYDYDAISKQTHAPLRLAPHGSVFVVFRREPDRPRLFSVRRNGKAIFPVSPGHAAQLPVIEVLPGKQKPFEVRIWTKGKYQLRKMHGRIGWLDVTVKPVMRKMSGPWEVRFPKGWGAPEAVTFDELISWTGHPDPGVKYFSGTATYRKAFGVPVSLLGEDRYLALDLGDVRNIAEVTLNGNALGTLWKPPFRVDITGLLKEQDNLLEIKVTNLWPNRLIGDRHLPEDKRFTRTNVTKFTKDSPLLPSGLLGPVHVFVAGRAELDF